MKLFRDKILSLITEKNGKLKNLGPLIYGTAGFRMNYYEDPQRIHQVVIMCTLISFLKSIMEKKWVGIMITASHNPVQDNGVKLIDTTGSMLNREFEEICSEVINTEISDDRDPIQTLISYYQKKIWKDGVFNLSDFSNAKLVVGYDSRPSSPFILECIERVINLFNVSNYLNFGYSTTPQMHFMVALVNGFISSRIPKELEKISKLNNFLENIENINTFQNNSLISFFFDIYYSYHEYYFSKLLKQVNSKNIGFIKEKSQYLQASWRKIHEFKSNNTGNILIDVANGVGKYHVDRFSKILKLGNIQLNIINNDDPNKLNDGCGAEYIQKNLLPPVNFYCDSTYNQEKIDYVAAFDGDADRLVYFIPNLEYNSKNKSTIFLMDGDRLSVCYSIVIVSILNEIVQNIKLESENSLILSLGIIQTAYANGASTNYLKNLVSKLNPKFFESTICCVPTGVKHLHRKSEDFDIAVYFEANGHGTVIHKKDKLNHWKNEIVKLYNKNINTDLNIENLYLLEFLENFLNLFNPVIGDAISDLLAFEISRIYIQGDFGCKFAMELYDDLYVIQDKITLERSKLNMMICDKETERFLLEPKKLQKEIDNYIRNLSEKPSRAFVRPSGTEEVARIYVEAPNISIAKKIIEYIKSQIYIFFQIDRDQI